MRPNSELKIIGEHYGFPACCVDYFLENNGKPGWVDYISNTNFSGTGYVPCPVCGEKPKKIISKEIAQRRSHPTPFPESDAKIMAESLGLDI